MSESKRKAILDRAYRYCHDYFNVTGRGKPTPMHRLNQRLAKLCSAINTDCESLLRSDSRFTVNMSEITGGYIVICNDFDYGSDDMDDIAIKIESKPIVSESKPIVNETMAQRLKRERLETSAKYSDSNNVELLHTDHNSDNKPKQD